MPGELRYAFWDWNRPRKTDKPTVRCELLRRAVTAEFDLVISAPRPDGKTIHGMRGFSAQLLSVDPAQLLDMLREVVERHICPEICQQTRATREEVLQAFRKALEAPENRWLFKPQWQREYLGKRREPTKEEALEGLHCLGNIGRAVYQAKVQETLDGLREALAA